MKYRKATSMPGKCDAQLQFNFYQGEMLPGLAQAAMRRAQSLLRGRRTLRDGSLPGHALVLRAGCSSRPRPDRQRYSVLGAIESHSHEIISVTTDGTVSAALVAQLLDKIRQTHPEAPITLILDNARYQRCKEVAARAASKGIELLYLPAYSPNLNLIERLWKLTKEKCLTNRHYQNFSDFREAIDSCLQRMSSDYLDDLKRLVTLNFQFFPFHKSS